MNGTSKRAAAGLAIGLGLAVIAGVVGLDAARMQVPPTYAKVGPQVFPLAIALGLALCGARLAWEAFKGQGPAPDAEAGATDWWSAGIAAVVLLAQVYLIKPLGFVVCAALVFFAIAYAFGSRRFLRDAAIGLGLALAAYGAFTYGLGLSLPPGPFKGLV